MKKKKSWLPLFLSGFLLMTIAQFAIRCEKYTGYPGDNDNPDVFDEKAVEKVAETIEAAFLSGDQAKVKALMTGSSLEFYSNLIQETTAENLKTFGNAFKTRTLNVISDGYAEYQFSAGGKMFTIALSYNEEEGWKIMRL
jgi:hypothetical protein